MSNAERTLVKSPPELWELVDDTDLMRRWAADLLGDPEGAIEVTERLEGERLAWRPAGRDESVAIELSLAEKGWGTNVTIAARDPAAPPTADALEELLDELSAPQRRPFARG